MAFLARTPPGETPVHGLPPCCTICLAEEWTSESEPTVTHCQHVFHKACLRDWLASDNTCPNCRQVVNLTDCVAYTGAIPKRYITRQKKKQQQLPPQPLPPPRVEQQLPSTGRTEASPESLNLTQSRGMSPNRPGLEHTASASHSLLQNSRRTEDPTNLVSAQALLAGLQLQMSELVQAEVARRLENVRREPSLELDGTTHVTPPTDRHQWLQPEPQNRPTSDQRSASRAPSRSRPVHQPGRFSLPPSYQRLPFQQEPVPPSQGVRPQSGRNFSHQRSASPIRRWPLLFDGNNSRLHVEEFIFRVETLTRTALRGDFNLLADNIHLLFNERVSNWYWAILRSNPTPSWEYIKASLRADWGERRSDVGIRARLYTRHQQPREAFIDYYQDLLDLRNRLQEPMPENEFVKVVRNNLLPSIKQQMWMYRTDNIEQLRSWVRGFEEARNEIVTTTASFTSRRPRLEESYFHEVGEEQSPDAEHTSEILAVIDRASAVCWNCDQTGHYYQDCEEEWRGTFCFGCGRKGTVKPRCPNCTKNPRRVERSYTSTRPALLPARRTPEPQPTASAYK